MKDDIFHYGSFSDVSVQSNDFIPGFEDDDFHVLASSSGSIQRLQLKGNHWSERHEPINGWKAISDYDFIRVGHKAYVFQLDRLSRLDLTLRIATAVGPIWPLDRYLHESGFLVDDPATDDFFALMDHTTLDQSSLELRRVHPNLKSDLVVEFPENPRVYPFSDGFALIPKHPGPIAPYGPYRIFHPDGQAYEGPMLRALNALKDSGLIIHDKAFWATSLRRPWALVKNDRASTGPSSHLWVMTLADSAGHPRTSPVAFETRVSVLEEVQSLVLSPAHDLYLATIRDTSGYSDSVTLWMGRVVRRGDTYEALNYRVRRFKGVRYMTLSRDGSTVIFFTRHQGESQICGARIADIVADINRRYPEAQLDLAALKAEMR